MMVGMNIPEVIEVPKVHDCSKKKTNDIVSIVCQEKADGC